MEVTSLQGCRRSLFNGHFSRLRAADVKPCAVKRAAWSLDASQVVHTMNVFAFPPFYIPVAVSFCFWGRLAWSVPRFFN